MNLFEKAWVIIKLFYLHVAYVFAGLDEEHFYLVRGNYFADLGWFNYAIGNYKKALKESKNPQVEAALGWCYSQIDNLEKSLEYYRNAYSVSKNPSVAIGLAYIEYYSGHHENSKTIVHELTNTKDKLDKDTINEIEKLQTLYASKN